MNQDQFQNQNENEAVFFDAPVKKNAKYYRAQARERLSNRWGIAILVAFLAILLGGISVSSSFNINIDLPTAETSSGETASLFGEAESAEEEDAVELTVELTEQQQQLLQAFAVATAVFAVIISVGFELFVAAPVKVGYRRFLLETVDENAAEIRVPTLFRYFKSGYFKTVRLNTLQFLISLVTLIPLLLSLGIASHVLLDAHSLAELQALDLKPLVRVLLKPALIVVGGLLVSALLSVLATYVFGFAYVIMADCPTATALEALRSSCTLMRGNKWKLFCLDISFIGWYLPASLFTCGIGLIFLSPYHYTARALFYHDIARRDDAKHVEFPSIDPDDGEAADPIRATAPTTAPTEESASDKGSAESSDGLSPRSLESIQFPSLDLDDDN